MKSVYLSGKMNSIKSEITVRIVLTNLIKVSGCYILF